MSESLLSFTELRTQGRGPYSLSLAAGECISLRGASGSGKSLLLRAIADLDPHEGQVTLDGVACTSMPAPRWRCLVALLPAESQWWADEVGAHFPDGDCPYWAPLGFGPEVRQWQVSRLSTGEKQRLALARALMNRPRVLLLDEPTASLDPANTQALEAVVAAYQQEAGAAVLWISHDSAQAGRVGQRHFYLTTHGLEKETP